MKKINRVKYLFVIGRPGSGKTTIINIILENFRKNKINTRVLNDWEILNQFAKEKKYPKLIQSIDKGFKVLDDEIYVIALERLMSELLSNSCFDINIIEFSRSSYLSSFKYISKFIDKNSYVILYLSSDFEQCIIRNNKRISHQVPIEIMKLKFKNDDILFFENAGFETVQINNNEGIIELNEKINSISSLLINLFFHQKVKKPFRDNNKQRKSYES